MQQTKLQLQHSCSKKIRFTEIATVVEHTLNQIQNSGAESIELILQADQNARTVAQHFVLNKGS